jgi:integrase
MRARYTLPKLVKGKKPEYIPKGSTIETELARNIWYVHYSYNGKQYRIKEGLNRIKDPKDKAKAGEVLRASIQMDLENGYNPEQPEIYIEQLSKETITLTDAVANFIADIKKYLRKKSVQSYESKLRYLAEAYPNKQLKDINEKNIEKYIQSKIRNVDPARMYMNGEVIQLDRVIKWTPNTVKAARRVFSAFFVWCENEKYITDNPMKKIEAKRIRSEVEAPIRNIPFSKGDLTAIMEYLDANDTYTAFFCRFIYETCMRPGEISKLKVKDFNLQNRQITVPLSVAKNTKKSDTDTVYINTNLYNQLVALKLSEYPKEYYITSKDLKNIVGVESIGENVPYKRFRKALVKLDLHEKGYNLYSFKHYSNIAFYRAGWSLDKLMKRNRHSSLLMTERYMKDLVNQTDISDLEGPAI